jgi:hypothetical protein
MVSVPIFVFSLCIAMGVGCTVGVLVLALMTRKRSADLEWALWQMICASKEIQDNEAFCRARDGAFRLLRGS